MPGKNLTFENGDVVDACDHGGGDDVIDRPGANPFCRTCGEVNPEVSDE